MLTPQQIEMRRGGITATDVAAIVGCHPYRTKLDVWLDKTGNAPPFAGDETRSRWGDILEGPIRTDYEERHRVRVEIPGTLRHRSRRWAMATPDGIVYHSGSSTPDRGLEIKVHGRDAVFFGGLEYGAPGSDEVPAHELIQCMWNIDVAELGRWDEVAFLDGAPIEFNIDRDDELIGMLVEQSERFLVDHIKTNTPPPPDGSRAWDEWLKRRWAKNTDELVSIDGDEGMEALIADLRAARERAVDLELATDTLVQQAKKAIGDRAGLTWREPGRKALAKLTWKRSKDGHRDDRTATIAAMRLAASLGATPDPELDVSGNFARAIEALTTIATMPMIQKLVPGPRPFCAPRWWKTTKTETDSATDNTEEN